MTLTKEEQITNAETFRHIITVRALLLEGVRELVNRADAQHGTIQDPGTSPSDPRKHPPQDRRDDETLQGCSTLPSRPITLLTPF